MYDTWSFIYFPNISTNLLIITNNNIKRVKSNKKYIYWYFYLLVVTTCTEAGRKYAIVLDPPSLESGKACCIRTPKYQHIRVTTIANDDNQRSEKSHMKPHKKTRKVTKSQQLRRTHNSSRRSPTLGAPPE
jgi:hypothetical protein